MNENDMCNYFCTFGGRVELSETVPADHGLIAICLLMHGPRGFEVELVVMHVGHRV